MLRHASALHDVGKIGIPDNVLLKPGGLDPDEWRIMQSHTAKGAEILAGSTSPLIQMAEAIARTHHERWDGTGYPNGLAGEDIPLEGRICAICDVYDALGSKRPYKEAWPVAARARGDRTGQREPLRPGARQGVPRARPRARPGRAARTARRRRPRLAAAAVRGGGGGRQSSFSRILRNAFLTLIRSPSNSNRSQPRTSNGWPSSSVARNVHSAAPRSPATITSVSANSPSG